MASTTEEAYSASVLSRLDSENHTPSNALPDTPNTTYEDSTLSKQSLVREASPAESFDNSRARTQIGSYKETVMPGRVGRRSSAQPGNRTISGTTLIDDGPNNNLSQDSIDRLDLERSPQQASSKDVAAQEGLVSVDKVERRRSTRISRLVKATESVVQKVSVLGKRGREAVDAGKAITVNAATKIQRRASLRIRTKELELEPRSEPKKDGEPPAKKTKLAKEALAEDRPAPSGSRRKTKIWLDRGLYVGQDPGFNPRLTERRNRLNAAARKSDQARPRSILPLPMFAGARLLERGRDFKLPFDVYSPVPPGQPKPEEWRKKSKNDTKDIFIGEAATLWKSYKHDELSRCICTPESGCDEECQNRFMFYECDDNNCNVGAEHCTNRSFEDLRRRHKAGGKYNIGVDVIKTADRGYGVRSNRTFEPHQIILEYAGEIITQEECDRRMNKEYKNNECYYLMSFDQNMIIDATRGSIARFINHSCEPNCKIVKWTVAGKPRMALFAAEKGIMTGDELTYDYNFDPFSTKSVQKCLCGSANCRGVLGPRAKDGKIVSPPHATPTTKTMKAADMKVPVKRGPGRPRKHPMPGKGISSIAKTKASLRKTEASVPKTKRRKAARTFINTAPRVRKSVARVRKTVTGPKALKLAAQTAKARATMALRRAVSRQGKHGSGVPSEPDSTRCSVERTIKPGVARSLRRIRKSGTSVDKAGLDSQSTIWVIPDSESG
ncbi:MAG: hypothetical protein M1815_000283 [Lichina confinis]|nr:MAG: hypothetical protein M1815_000283 [Lichina confinis]